MIKLCGSLLAACIECVPKVSLNRPQLFKHKEKEPKAFLETL